MVANEVTAVNGRGVIDDGIMMLDEGGTNTPVVVGLRVTVEKVVLVFKAVVVVVELDTCVVDTV